MKDMDKTKEELLAEIAELSRRIEMFEKAEPTTTNHGGGFTKSEAKYRQLVDIAFRCNLGY